MPDLELCLVPTAWRGYPVNPGGFSFEVAIRDIGPGAYGARIQRVGGQLLVEHAPFSSPEEAETWCKAEILKANGASHA